VGDAAREPPDTLEPLGLLDQLLQVLVLLLGLLPRGDVTDVALDHLLRIDEVDVADELDGDLPPVAPLQRQIVVTNVLPRLQVCERSPGVGPVLEGPDLPEVTAQEVALRGSRSAPGGRG
jgi:hypothetical protein